MQRLSFAHAKAHLSELVDHAEHRGQRVIILRHGKPAAAIVPVAVAMPEQSARAPQRLTRAEAKRVMDAIVAAVGDFDPGVSAVDDLVSGRR